MKKILYLLVLMVAFSGIVYAEEYNLVGDVLLKNLVPTNPNLHPVTLLGDFDAVINSGPGFESTGIVFVVGTDNRGREFSVNLRWNTDVGDLNIIRNDNEMIIFETTGTQLLLSGTARPDFRENFLLTMEYDKIQNQLSVQAARFGFLDMQSFTT